MKRRLKWLGPAARSLRTLKDRHGQSLLKMMRERRMDWLRMTCLGGGRPAGKWKAESEKLSFEGLDRRDLEISGVQDQTV